MCVCVSVGVTHISSRGQYIDFLCHAVNCTRLGLGDEEKRSGDSILVMRYGKMVLSLGVGIDIYLSGRGEC